MTYDFIFPGLLGTVSVACNFRFWRFRASALIEEVFAARTGSRPIAGCRSLADSYCGGLLLVFTSFISSFREWHFTAFHCISLDVIVMSLLSFVFQEASSAF